MTSKVTMVRGKADTMRRPHRYLISYHGPQSGFGATRTNQVETHPENHYRALQSPNRYSLTSITHAGPDSSIYMFRESLR